MFDTPGCWPVSVLLFLNLNLSCFCFLDLCPCFSFSTLTTMRNNDERLQTVSSPCSVRLSISDTVTFPFSLTLSGPASLSPDPSILSLSSFVVLRPTLRFRMRSLPVLISCYFPTSCPASLSHSSFLALHPSLPLSL